MRRDVTAALVLAISLAEPSASADEPQVVVEPPLPDKAPERPPPEPSPVTIEMPAGRSPPQTAPAPPPAASAAPPAPPPRRDRPTFGEMGIGATYLGALQSKRAHSEAGLVLQAGARVPIGDHCGFGFRFAYGMTGWDRTEDVARRGYKIGRWTTQAYGDVWDWAGEGEESERSLRYFAAFFGFIGLIFPYALAGMIYMVSPFAASSYGEVDATFDWEPGDDPKYGPYLKGGLGLMAYVHPDTGHLYGGLGPTFGLGYRADTVRLGVIGTLLPSGAHGGDATEHILVGSFTVSVAH